MTAFVWQTLFTSRAATWSFSGPDEPGTGQGRWGSIRGHKESIDTPNMVVGVVLPEITSLKMIIVYFRFFE